MNTTGTVLFVRNASADRGGPGALEGKFEVVVAEGAVDAVKRLSRDRDAVDCVVTPPSVVDLPVDAFVNRVRQEAPDACVVVVGELPTGAGVADALVEADAYVPAGRDDALDERVGRLLEERRVDRAVAEHDRLEETVKRVAVAVSGSPDREAIESAVYEELVDGNGYRHVWIARHDDDTLAVSLPVSGRIGTEELGDLVGGGDPAFADRAAEKGQVVSTEGQVPTRSAATDVPLATIHDGGETTLASAAVPFVHDGRVYGLGIVSTERLGAFDGSERSALSDLGAVVGHALWAVESSSESAAFDLGRGMENLVHDLRNPLGIARSHLDIAREDDAEDSLDRVESALDRMDETIDRVAAGLTGEPRADPDEIGLSIAARTAWDSIEAEAASLDVDRSVQVRADTDLLVRLLSNLFQNAVDHGGDSVAVRVVPTSDGFVVEDDGPGIPPSDREAVFERGYSTSSDGLGIGLSIVQDVANAHGWEVAIDESSAGGARFEFNGVDVREDSQVEENETA